MNIVITGAEGFIGRHLARFLAERRENVIGTYFDENDLIHLKKIPDVEAVFCDVRNKKNVEEIIRKYRPEFIYHLAAQSRPTDSIKDPWTTMETNVTGTLNIFEVVKQLKLDTKIFVACSSSQYGIQENRPIDETYPFHPTTVYAVSKIAADMLAYQYFTSYGIKCIRGRLFNTTGPGKLRDATGDFATQIVEIEKGRREPNIYVGNLSPLRSISDVRDMVRAIVLCTEKGKDGEAYNLCSGYKPVSMKQVLDTLISLSTEKDKIKIIEDEKRFRPVDEPVIWGDNSKLRALGWKPNIPLEQTLNDVLDYFRMCL